MRLDIDFTFDVGTEERHIVTFHWGQLLGRVLITVDGHEVVAKNRAVPLGRTRTRKFEFSVGHAEVHDVVTRAISGHQTSRMQRHYSTARREEMREAVGKVISLATARARREAPRKRRRAT